LLSNYHVARAPVFTVFNPAQYVNKWNMILRKMDVDFEAQIYYCHAVEIRTRIGHIGSSSFTVEHEAWQRGDDLF
jgi:acyl-CoA thioester hydrolase